MLTNARWPIKNSCDHTGLYQFFLQSSEGWYLSGEFWSCTCVLDTKSMCMSTCKEQVATSLWLLAASQSQLCTLTKSCFFPVFSILNRDCTSVVPSWPRILSVESLRKWLKLKEDEEIHEQQRWAFAESNKICLEKSVGFFVTCILGWSRCAEHFSIHVSNEFQHPPCCYISEPMPREVLNALRGS